MKNILKSRSSSPSWRLSVSLFAPRPMRRRSPPYPLRKPSIPPSFPCRARAAPPTARPRCCSAPRKIPALTTSSSSAIPSRKAGKAPAKTSGRKYYGQRKCINFGVGGDRTQHVLWRFEHGQLDGIKAKVAVVMIGTNNSNNERQHRGRHSRRRERHRAANPHAAAGHQNHAARHFSARPDLQRATRKNSAGQRGARQAR